jgi:hypothetical protein
MRDGRGRKNAYAYQYVVEQTSKGGGRVELFGRDTVKELSHDDMERMRRQINKDGNNTVHVSRIALRTFSTGKVVRDSKLSKLQPEPLFTIE